VLNSASVKWMGTPFFWGCSQKQKKEEEEENREVPNEYVCCVRHKHHQENRRTLYFVKTEGGGILFGEGSLNSSTFLQIREEPTRAIYQQTKKESDLDSVSQTHGPKIEAAEILCPRKT